MHQGILDKQERIASGGGVGARNPDQKRVLFYLYSFVFYSYLILHALLLIFKANILKFIRNNRVVDFSELIRASITCMLYFLSLSLNLEISPFIFLLVF